MRVEIQFPLEFLVQGTPVSLQAKRPQSLVDWKALIVSAVQPLLPENHFLSANPLAITLFYFPPSRTQGDIDNIVKPILDAMTRRVYMDDNQFHRVLVQKFEPGGIFQFASPSETLAGAIEGTKPILYVRLSDDPFEDLA
jgi:crossover junction endodeoxyribonuclease RusA